MAAVLVGAGLAIAVVAVILRVRTRQRTLAQILDDTMGTAQVPVEVVSESPERGELSALTVRIAGIFGRIDTSGALEQRLDRAAIPLRSGEYLVISAGVRAHAGGGRRASSWASIIGAVDRHRAGGHGGVVRPDAPGQQADQADAGAACPTRWPSWRPRSRVARPSSGPSTCTAVMPGPPLSAELDRVMAEVAVGSDLVVALENMAERSGVEDLKWAVEAVRIQQSTGGRLAPDPAHAGRVHAHEAGGPPRGADAFGRGPDVGLRALRHPALPGLCARG